MMHLLYSMMIFVGALLAGIHAGSYGVWLWRSGCRTGGVLTLLFAAADILAAGMLVKTV